MIETSRPFALTFLLMIMLLSGACGNNVSFSSEAWLNGNARMRGRVSEDLVARKVLVGQGVDEVRRQLGQPDKDYGTAFEYRIDLGWPLKDPMHYGLQVHLDQDRVVREVKIVD